MKIRVLSDLHLEFYSDPAEAGIQDDVECDGVVLAGDIHLGTRGLEWAAATFDRPVIYVMGNHEFYDHDAAELLPRAREVAAELGVHLLENDEARIDGVRFLGCALWTGFEAGPWPQNDAATAAHMWLNDFRLIREHGRLVTPSRMMEWHWESLAWLESRLDPADPAVVVTHFAPTLKTVHPRFGAGDALTPYFHCDLERLMGAAVPVWIYGHNHYSATESLIAADGSTTLVCSNQRGYPGENTGFLPEYVLEV